MNLKPLSEPYSRIGLATWLGALALLAACSPSVSPPGVPTQPPVAYAVTGVVQRLPGDGRTVLIRHDTIPGYMQAMTMPFVARDPRELGRLSPGDQITFRLLVTETDAWIDRVRQTGQRVELTTSPVEDLLQVVDELEPGDPLPDCALVNDQGHGFKISDLRGRATALTFFFTRCPLPTYCPLLSRHFAAVHEQMMALDPTGNWHLLSVSFDPEFDTPKVLGMYARQYRTDTNHWTFATGERQAIEALGRELGLQLVREPGTISHNLRTVVVTPSGHLQHVFRDNEWQPSDLVAKLREADPGPDAISTDPPLARARLELTGMSCEGCAQAIQTALSRESGIQTATVSYTDAQAEITYHPRQTAPVRWIRLLRELNYDGSILR